MKILSVKMINNKLVIKMFGIEKDESALGMLHTLLSL